MADVIVRLARGRVGTGSAADPQAALFGLDETAGDNTTATAIPVPQLSLLEVQLDSLDRRVLEHYQQLQAGESSTVDEALFDAPVRGTLSAEGLQIAYEALYTLAPHSYSVVPLNNALTQDIVTEVLLQSGRSGAHAVVVPGQLPQLELVIPAILVYDQQLGRAYATLQRLFAKALQRRGSLLRYAVGRDPANMFIAPANTQKSNLYAFINDYLVDRLHHVPLVGISHDALANQLNRLYDQYTSKRRAATRYTLKDEKDLEASVLAALCEWLENLVDVYFTDVANIPSVVQDYNQKRIDDAYAQLDSSYRYGHR
jgi:hypothetical protein